MMKKISFLTLMLATLTMGATAQTENPRGIYKMMTLTGKAGEVEAPFDQYKVCTDSITLTVMINNVFFRIYENDHTVFNYTGEQPKDENDRRSLIYDSNAEHFSLKWWSSYTNHKNFPKDDWCIEKYEAGQYSELGRIAFGALTGKAEVDARNPLTGTWRIVGYVDELKDVKKNLPQLHEQYAKSKYFNSFRVWSPANMVLIAGGNGSVSKVEYDGKNSYKMGTQTHSVKWISKDCIAVEERIDYRTDWEVLERVTDGRTPLSCIAGQMVRKAGPMTYTKAQGADKEKSENGTAEEKTYDWPIYETRPLFHGGQEGLINFLTKNLQYPDLAQRYGVEGRVIMSFVVDKDGSIKDVSARDCKIERFNTTKFSQETEVMQNELKEQFAKLFAKEGYRVVKMMPKWAPGRVKGEAVPTKMSLPITFKIPNK
jgi:protein TonB